MILTVCDICQEPSSYVFLFTDGVGDHVACKACVEKCEAGVAGPGWLHELCAELAK